MLCRSGNKPWLAFNCRLLKFWKAYRGNSMKRIDGKTPFGGDYAEFHFLDAENNEVDEGKETSIVIRECKADGTLVKETWAKK